MRYWWVNQNKTHAYEIAHGFMWSPKRNTNAAYNQFYENMRHVSLGDPVFSYYGQHVRHIGRITGEALAIPKPAAFAESWDIDGWYVPVEWHNLEKPVDPRAILNELRRHLPTKYSPIQAKTGKGLQGVYLAELPKAAADVLVRAGGTSAAAALTAAVLPHNYEEAIARAEDEVERTIDADPDLSATQKEELRLARRGQGKFRANLRAIEKGCRVTGVTDERLLVASHIKPWSVCRTSDERLDGNNGLLLARHIDHLFDNGWLTFDDNGDVRLSSRIAPSELVRLGLDGRPMNVGPFTAKQRKYLCYHRDAFKP